MERQESRFLRNSEDVPHQVVNVSNPLSDTKAIVDKHESKLLRNSEDVHQHEIEVTNQMPETKPTKFNKKITTGSIISLNSSFAETVSNDKSNFPDTKNSPSALQVAKKDDDGCVQDANNERKSKPFHLFYHGFQPKYLWQDNIIGGNRIYMGNSEEAVAWNNFFIDLLYVALATRLSSILQGCVADSRVIIIIYSIASIFFHLRMNLDEYSIKFYTDDIFHRSIYFLYIVGVVIMGMTSSGLLDFVHGHGYSSEREECDLNYSYFQKYLVGYLIARISSAILYIVASHQDKSGRFYKQYITRMIILTISTIICVVSVFVDNTGLSIALFFISSEFEYFVLGVVAFMKKYYNYFKDVSPYNYPVNYYITQDRCGDYIVVFIGEGLVQLMEHTPTDINFEVISTYFFALLLLFGFAVQYFDRVQRLEGEIHAAGRNFFYGYLYFMSHKDLAFSLLILTNGLYDDSKTGMQFLSTGCAFTTLVMIFMRMTHKGIRNKTKDIKHIAYLSVELLLFVAHLLVLISDLDHHNRVVIHGLLVLVYIMFDIVGVYFHKHAPGTEYSLSHGATMNLNLQRNDSVLKVLDIVKNPHQNLLGSIQEEDYDTLRQSIEILQKVDFSTTKIQFGKASRRVSITPIDTNFAEDMQK